MSTVTERDKLCLLNASSGLNSRESCEVCHASASRFSRRFLAPSLPGSKLARVGLDFAVHCRHADRVPFGSCRHGHRSCTLNWCKLASSIRSRTEPVPSHGGLRHWTCTVRKEQRLYCVLLSSKAPLSTLHTLRLSVQRDSI